MGGGDLIQELHDDEEEDEDEESGYYHDEEALDDDHDTFTEKYKELRAKRKELLKTLHEDDTAGKRKAKHRHMGASANRRIAR